MQAKNLFGQTARVQPAKVNVQDLRQQISEKYSEVALMPDKGFHFHTGSFLAIMLGYDAVLLDGVPAGTVESFAGTGNPFSMGDLKVGEIVLDIGSGAGFDSLIAARQVAPDGRVVGVDMTDAMLEKAAEGAHQMGLTNVEFRKGLAEKLPVEDESIDVVISNGVINLCPDKEVVMREVHRVLKPGGRFQIADIVVHKEVPQDAKDNIELWSGWIAGALQDAEWTWVLNRVGFDGIRWGKQVDVFSGSKHESSASEFDTFGVTFAGVKR